MNSWHIQTPNTHTCKSKKTKTKILWLEIIPGDPLINIGFLLLFLVPTCVEGAFKENEDLGGGGMYTTRAQKRPLQQVQMQLLGSTCSNSGQRVMTDKKKKKKREKENSSDTPAKQGSMNMSTVNSLQGNAKEN